MRRCHCSPGDVTTGTLGFVKFGDREWLPEELNALQAIATLFAQVQARIQAEERLQYLAEHDDLTGLLNRRALIARLDERLAAGRPGPVRRWCIVNLDRLKAVNDHLGHNAGDRFIEVFAQLLRDAADDSSVIARFGGDEFVVVPTSPWTSTRPRHWPDSCSSAFTSRWRSTARPSPAQ